MNEYHAEAPEDEMDLAEDIAIVHDSDDLDGYATRDELIDAVVEWYIDTM